MEKKNCLEKKQKKVRNDKLYTCNRAKYKKRRRKTKENRRYSKEANSGGKKIE